MLKEPGAHDIRGRLGEDAAFLLLTPAAIVVVLTFGTVAAAERSVSQEGPFLFSVEE